MESPTSGRDVCGGGQKLEETLSDDEDDQGDTAGHFDRDGHYEIGW